MIDIHPYNPSHHSRAKDIFAQSMLETFYQNQLMHIWSSKKLILCQIFIFVAVSLTSGSPLLALGSVIIYCLGCRTEHWTTATYFRSIFDISSQLFMNQQGMDQLRKNVIKNCIYSHLFE